MWLRRVSHGCYLMVITHLLCHLLTFTITIHSQLHLQPNFHSKKSTPTPTYPSSPSAPFLFSLLSYSLSLSIFSSSFFSSFFFSSSSFSPFLSLPTLIHSLPSAPWRAPLSAQPPPRASRPPVAPQRAALPAAPRRVGHAAPAAPRGRRCATRGAGLQLPGDLEMERGREREEKE